MKRVGIRSISEKRARSGVRRGFNSTFAVVRDANRLAASDLTRSSPMPARKAPIKKRNPARMAVLGKRYQEGLRKYRASDTWRVVEARCQGRCEFAIAFDPLRVPRVLDVRIDRPVPDGYARACRRRRRSHHHLTYVRFGGDELPEDMLAGCPGCHEYVEATKAVHR